MRRLMFGYLLLAIAAFFSNVSPAASQSGYEVVTSFTAATFSGDSPEAGVLQGNDGAFYGVTSAGGAFGYGTVFTAANGTLTILHSFAGLDGRAPFARLTQAGDGHLYGTTSSGGAGFQDLTQAGNGTVFQIDTSGTLTTLYSFSGTDGSRPMAGVIQASDGLLYGTTADGGTFGKGTVFRLDATTGILATLYSFSGSDGAQPMASLIQSGDGRFHGTTQGGGQLNQGTLFHIDFTGTLTTDHHFSGTDGTFPITELLEASDGSFYGTTWRGGAGSGGTVFKWNPAGTFTTLYNFGSRTGDGAAPQGGLIQASDGRIYGTTTEDGATIFAATVFSLDASGTLTTLASFPANIDNPGGGLLQARDGTLYGTAREGGNFGAGAIFRIDTTNTLSTVVSFGAATADGFSPWAGLIQGTDGRFYGTTLKGGDAYYSGGTVFALDGAATLTTLHRFSINGNSMGLHPRGGLLQANDGHLYGTLFMDPAEINGPRGIFAIDSDGTYGVVDSGMNSAAGLMQASDGLIYGTTYGSPGYPPFYPPSAGGIFRVAPCPTLSSPCRGSGASIVSGFSAGNGKFPTGALIEASDGSLYGTTAAGGQFEAGTVFRLTTSGALTTLHHFTGADGAAPLGKLLQTPDGRIYGTTSAGGDQGLGTVFVTDPSGTFTTLHSFTGVDGSAPGGSLLLAGDGRFYGTTRTGGAYGFGTLFTIDVQGTLTTLRSFAFADGSAPNGDLIQARDGLLYGTTQAGGPAGGGVVFRLVLAGQVTPVPWHIEAEDYDPGGQGVGYNDSTAGNEGGAYRHDDVDLKPSREGGVAVGWFTAGEWLAYTINVERAGLYTVRARVGSVLPGRTFHLEADGVVVTGPIAVPVEPDWDHYDTVQVDAVRLHAGTQVLRVVMDGLDFMDFQWFEVNTAGPASGPVGGAPHAIPGQIEASDYDFGGPGVGYNDTTIGHEPGGAGDRADDVDIKDSAEGGYAVGWFTAGEWLAYTIDVPQYGLYAIEARVGSPLPGRTFHVEVDGLDVTGPVAVPQVADWDQYQTVMVPGIALHPGVQVVHVVMGPEDFMDFKWFAVTADQVLTFTAFDVPGAAGTQARGINNVGAIVGVYRDAAGNDSNFVRQPDGALVTFDYPGADHTYASSINDAGDVVGYYDNDSTPPFYFRHGFLRRADGTFVTIDYPAARYTEATGITNAGVIVGSYVDTLSVTHGFIRSPAGVFADVSVAGATRTSVDGVNDALTTVGYWQGSAQSFSHGFALAQDGTLIDVARGTTAFPRAINRFGDIVGSMGSGLGMGFLQRRDGLVITLEHPDCDGYCTDPSGINDNGQVVGGFSPPGGLTHGFIASPGAFTTP